MNPRTDTQSQHITPPDIIRHDSTTGETLNRGVVIIGAKRNAHAMRCQREDDVEEACFRANVRLYGYDRAKELLDTVRAMENRWEAQ